MLSKIGSTSAAFALALSVLGLNGCNPVLRTHGYVPTDAAKPQAVVAETDSKASVLSQLGNPSVEGTFDEDLQSDTWYYINAVRERQAYLRPKVNERTITAITFDSDGMVTQVAEYGLEDGRYVDFVNRETPTRGRELSVIEQIFGTIGRLPTDRLLNTDRNIPGQGPGGR